MEQTLSLQDLIHRAGVVPDARQACLPAPQEPAVVASGDDHNQARNILLDRRAKNPESKDVLKRIFRGSKDKSQDKDGIFFSQEELDQALSAMLRGPQMNPGLTQAFIDLGAKVNFIETPEKKRRMSNQPNTGLRRRSNVLQQAATLRRPTCVSLLANSGADQTTLDESLKAALTSGDQSCIQELLRHGADLSKFPNALASAVRSNDQNYVRLLLRSPKPLKTDIISSALPAAVSQQSEQIASMLIAYGADPNFNSASALQMAIGRQDYRMAIILVAGPIPLLQPNLQTVLDTTMRLPTVESQLQFLQVLLCCGLSPNSIGLPGLLNCRTRQNDTAGVKMMLSYGVPTTANDAECLKLAVSHANWDLAEVIMQTPITSEQATAALSALSSDTSFSDRLRVIQMLIHKGASGAPLTYWLTRAVEDGDAQLTNTLLSAGTPVDASSQGPLYAAIKRKDFESLRLLLDAKPSPKVLSKAFPLLRTGYSSSERLILSQLLLRHGARGADVDEALVYAVADTSRTRDPALIQELIRGKADVNYDRGKAIQLSTVQIDVAVLQLICSAKPTPASTSSALPFVFDAQGNAHAHSAELVRLLLVHGVEEHSARQALQIAISGGPGNLEVVQLLVEADINLLSSAFEYTVAIKDPQKKAPILETLLKMGVPQETLDATLAAESHQVVTTKDTTNAKLLLDRGASVSHNDGEAFSTIVASRDSSLTKLFLSGLHQPSRSSVTRAFRKLHALDKQNSSKYDDDSVLSITRELLLRGVDQPAIDAALRITLSESQDDKDIGPLLDMLLEYNANVNTAEGVCLVFACSRQDQHTFEKLLQHRPDYRLIVPALLKSTLPDDQVVHAVKMCSSYGLTADDLSKMSNGTQTQSILVLAMDKYPRCEGLTNLLLDIGCNPNVTFTATVHPRTGEEAVSALLWAISQAEKRISDSVIMSLLSAGASVDRASPVSEITPLALSAREGRGELVRALLGRGADASARDKWNRSALFYASSVSNNSTVQAIASHALSNDGSLHEATRCLHTDIIATLIKFGHQPHFPSRVHQGRDALSELCLKGHITASTHRSKVRQAIRLLLDNGADPKFKVRNEKSAILHALDNPYSSLEMTEALLETEIWEDLNDEKHLYRASSGLWYSPIKYVELVPAPHRGPIQAALTELFSDKGCEPRYYSETAQQPLGAVGLPKSISQLADRQKEHELALKHEHERHEHARTREETIHKDELRRKKEQQTADFAAQAAAQQQWQALEQQKHDFEVHRVRDAEHMKRSEKVAWHNLIMEQERDAAARRQSIDDRKTANSLASEAKMIEQRKSELDHRAVVERRLLKDKEDVYERNVKRQTEVMKRADESAQLHAKLRQERPAIEGAPQWGSVD